MSYTEDFAESHAPLAKFGDDAFTTVQDLGYVNVKAYHRIAIVIHAIAVGTTLDVDIEVATDDAATGVFTLKSITQLASADDGALVIVDVQAEELGKPSGASSQNYDWLNVEVTPAGTCAASIIVYGIEPRYEPVDQTLWDEVVS